MQHFNSKSNLPDQPFRGIDSFRYADREIFSEREEEKEQLYNLIQIYRGVLLYGQSGIGKSSLIAAGLIPHLENRYQPEIIRLYPSNAGAFVISRIVADENAGTYLPSLFDKYRVENNAKISLSIEEFERTIKEQTFREDKIQILPGRKKLQQSQSGDTDTIIVEEEEIEEVKTKTPILIFDQFEELITLFEESGSKGEFNNSERLVLQQKIIQVLSQCYYNSNLKLKMLFVFREDYLAKFSNLFDVIPDLYNYCLRLKAIPKEKLDDIIEFPFEKDKDGSKYPNAFSAVYSQKLGEKLKEYFNEDDVSLTDVQIACLYLYRKVIDREKLLDQPAPIKNILEQFYLDILNQFSEKEKPVAISILSLLVLNDKTRNIYHRDAIIDAYLEQTGTKKISTLIARKTICEAVLNKLENEAKIIRQETRKGQSYYEIRSEAIIPYINQQKILKERNIEIRKKQKLRNQWLAYASIFVLLIIAFAIYNINKTRNQKEEITTLATLLKALYKGYEYEKGDDYLKAFQIYERLGKEKMEYVNQKVAKLKFSDYDISGASIFPLKNNFILSQFNDSTYRLWKIESKEKLSLRDEFHHASELVASKESSLFALFSGNELIYFDCEKNKKFTILKDTSAEKPQLKFSTYSNVLTCTKDNLLALVHPGTLAVSYYKIGDSYHYQNFLDNDKTLYSYYDSYIIRLKTVKDSLEMSKQWDMYYTSWSYNSKGEIIYLKKPPYTGRSDKGILVSIDLSVGTEKILSAMKFSAFQEISKNILLLYSIDNKDYSKTIYKDLAVYHVSSNRLIKLQSREISELTGTGMNTILKDKNGSFFIMDTSKMRLSKFELGKEVLSVSKVDQKPFILFVQRNPNTKGKEFRPPVLYKYDISSAKKELVDSVSLDFSNEYLDSAYISTYYNDYFFRVNSSGDLIAYKTIKNDTSYIVIKDMVQKKELYRSSKYTQQLDKISKSAFTETYIHLYDKSEREGIIILNEKPRDIRYFSALGIPKMNDEEWKKLLDSLELEDK